MVEEKDVRSQTPMAGLEQEEHPALVQAAREGDGQAADQLLELIAPQLLSWLDRQMGSRLRRFLSVADVAQESLASLLGSLDRLRPGAGLSDVRKLMFQHARWIVMRRGSDAGRFQGESVMGRTSNYDPPENSGVRSAGEVTLEDELSWLSELIQELDEEVGVVMTRRLEGVPFADLAAQLGLTESAVRKRFDRGLEELQRLGEARRG